MPQELCPPLRFTPWALRCASSLGLCSQQLGPTLRCKPWTLRCAAAIWPCAALQTLGPALRRRHLALCCAACIGPCAGWPRWAPGKGAAKKGFNTKPTSQAANQSKECNRNASRRLEWESWVGGAYLKRFRAGLRHVPRSLANLNPKPEALNPKHQPNQPINITPQILNLKPYTPNPTPYAPETLNPEP